MGMVHAEITLKNIIDVAKVYDGLLAEKDVRQVTVNALVDTGAGTLVIDEDMCRKLGLKEKTLRRSSLADSSKVFCKTTFPVEVHWQDRETSCEALVLPYVDEVLLGAIPLEGLDLQPNPVSRTLEGVHGNEPIY
jgi:clan AA aspartic protease